MQKKTYHSLFSPLPDRDVWIDPSPVPLPQKDISFLHYHNHYEIGLCLQGKGLSVTAGRAEVIQAGDLLFASPKTAHYSQAITPCICRFVYIPASAIKEILRTVVPGVIRPKEHPVAAEMLLQLMLDADRPQASRRILLRLELFLLEANAYFREAPAEITEEPMAEYLLARYNLPLTAKEMAAHFHVSESQLRRRFAAIYGEPPMAYRNRLRCSIGKELLSRTDAGVEEIARHLGFSSASDFYRLFRRFYNASPSAFKKQLRVHTAPVTAAACSLPSAVEQKAFPK